MAQELSCALFLHKISRIFLTAFLKVTVDNVLVIVYN